MKDYPSFTLDNLSRVSLILDSYMDQLDENPDAEIASAFEAVHLERKETIDERAATLRNLEACRLQLAEYKKRIEAKLKKIRELQEKLEVNTITTIDNFTVPFKGNYCELKTTKNKGSVEIKINTTNVSISNVIDVVDYQATDLPEDCLERVTYYRVKKSKLYEHLTNGLMIRDAKIIQSKSLKIRDIL